ncbi:small GTP-binding protein [Tritrichomonas foetus]|uniref:Small GTP-binding protein n=1 Tax=Tritrichomonas foetus TaxID=1144522 RepID=A0A1J4KFN3_9EUKA|nr:small GTP-binding protein [Tritrichomonas foetus]|eukprot:OHT08588.1 small GTP-binding protein [Tritrichomonas foetus]
MTQTYRIVMIGNAYVGKTALVMKCIHKTTQVNYDETIGAAFHTYNAKVNGIVQQFQVWDTAGTEKYRSLAPVYYRNASAAILVYDMTDKISFDELENWISIFKESSSPDSIIFIVANKNDLEDSIVISQQEGEKWAFEHHYPFFCTSAITGANVDNIFQTVAKKIARDTKPNVEKNLIEEKQNNNCC